MHAVNKFSRNSKSEYTQKEKDNMVLRLLYRKYNRCFSKASSRSSQTLPTLNLNTKFIYVLKSLKTESDSWTNRFRPLKGQGRERMAERSTSLARGRCADSSQIPAAAKIVIVISCPLAELLKIRQPQSVPTMPTNLWWHHLLWVNGASPEVFRQKHLFPERGY